MIEASDDRAISICSHCDREILSSNIDLHFAHCSLNLEKCKVCADMIPKKFFEEHFLSTHAQGLHGYWLLPITKGKGFRSSNIWNVRAPEPGQGAPRRQPRDFSSRHLTCTIAITGIAVLLGSFFSRRNKCNNLARICYPGILVPPVFTASLDVTCDTIDRLVQV